MRELWEFEGRWRVARRIEDLLVGRLGRFEGTATYTPDGDRLIYHEVGELAMAGVKPMAATRDYIWQAGEGGIEVLFDDGRPFHTIGATAAHWCDPDQYDVAYDFDRWPLWRAEWQVRGPRKNYVMQSEYIRISP